MNLPTIYRTMMGIAVGYMGILTDFRSAYWGHLIQNWDAWIEDKRKLSGHGGC